MSMSYLHTLMLALLWYIYLLNNYCLSTMVTCSHGKPFSSCSKIGAGRHYKPVSVDEGLPGATTAIPGECTVNDSWRYLSNAPVAYQMQQVTDVCYFFCFAVCLFFSLSSLGYPGQHTLHTMKSMIQITEVAWLAVSHFIWSFSFLNNVLCCLETS